MSKWHADRTEAKRGKCPVGFGRVRTLTVKYEIDSAETGIAQLSDVHSEQGPLGIPS
jgi:hypothetical protein